jgi:high-affinity K+ transport system ATPase subunit B
VLAAVVTLVFPALVAALAPGLIFLGFGALMVVQLIWVLRVMPETRGRVLEAAPIATGVATP